MVYFLPAKTPVRSIAEIRWYLPLKTNSNRAASVVLLLADRLNCGELTVITKCLFPVAGYGNRFLPATKAQPTVMLMPPTSFSTDQPITTKPLLDKRYFKR